MLAEVKMNGEEKVILIHIEPQASYQKEFHERMFIYYSRLYEKYRKPILPIALFSYADRREVPNTFMIDLPNFSILHFQYLQLHLILKDWRYFIKKDNPVVAALLSKMGYTKKERVQVKFEFLRMISRMQLNPARMELIYGFFETYLQLNEEEEEQMKKEIENLTKEEADRVFELPNYYRDKGREEGKKEGKKEGIEKVAYNMIKHGLSDELIAEVSGLSLQKVKELKEINDRVRKS